MNDSAVFTADEIPDPITNLRNHIPTNSSTFGVKNDLDAHIVTDNKTEIYIDAYTFINNSENLNADITINYNEMLSYSDFIIQSVDHHSDLGLTNTIFSFYIDATYANNHIEVYESGSIKVRIPSNELEADLYLGKGQFQDGKLLWNYELSDVNSEFEYISWEELDPNGGIKLKTGYELTVKKTGWYSFISKIETPTLLEVPFCLDYPQNTVYNNGNTAAYILLNDAGRFISSAGIMSSNNSYCTVDLPYLQNEEFKVVSISYFENSDAYHYFENDYIINGNISSIEVIPRPVSQSELLVLLKDL